MRCTTLQQIIRTLKPPNTSFAWWRKPIRSALYQVFCLQLLSFKIQKTLLHRLAEINVKCLLHASGRRSFGGYNKAVERNYEQIIDEKKFNKASEKASKNSVSDAEMLARYENLIGLPRGQSQGMRPKKDRAAHLKSTCGQIDKADHKT